MDVLFRFLLGNCVIGSHNTWYGDANSSKKYPRPCLYGVALNVQTGSIFPASFPDKNPDADLRHVRLSFRQFENYDEYNAFKDVLYQDFNDETGEFRIEPFQFSSSPNLTFIAKAPDKLLLENMSTSPKVEPKDFCSSIRNAVKFILDHPDPFQSVFINQQPRCYLFSDNEKKWIQIKKQN